MQSKITKITAQKRKGRFNIFIDDHYAFPVSENVLIQFQLVKDMEIDEQLEKQLLAAEQIDKIYQKAINYIASQLRTEKEVTTKLETETDDSDIIGVVIQKLHDNHLLDDQSYANSYVRSEVRIMDKGPVAITQHLKQKGVGDVEIQTALADYYAQDDRLANGLHQAQKMFKRYRNDSFSQVVNKVKNGLARKGYAFDLINTIIEQADFHVDEQAQRQVLKKQFDKAWHRYRELDNRNRQFKTKQFLYRKGFQIDDIERLINEQSF
ncbi:recombination regulator RecX [Lactobacillus sp. Sy-1]|uniref:recombination regulator RecX n=1 Tax=Lactobacillus sp. Sy-1 TaxID=2109645 RepID=UPI001C570D35|nr:recombination regulator RecX [Lactobacillus sp. Sy-1]MBW1605384.1 recombination regulator RecX [Lactobacillus sp. Sy-1]